mmetsp:Transcript_27135/g.39714  ORF Transcript_27135/g.39714 Transcript_27135/m.39714 type:complete len:1174 (-) Transcript_27135:240-3761(-)
MARTKQSKNQNVSTPTANNTNDNKQQRGNSSNSSMTPKSKLVGNPLLNFDNSSAFSWSSKSFEMKNEGKVKGPTPINRRPIITPSGSGSGKKQCRYALLPNDTFVEVLSLETGHTVCSLTIKSSSSCALDEEKKEEEVTIEAVCLALLPKLKREKNSGDGDDDESTSSSSSEDNDEDEEEYVILAGCNNGSIKEWDFVQINSTNSSSTAVPPRRAFALPSYESKAPKGTAGAVTHLTSPFFCLSSASTTNAAAVKEEKEGAIVFALTRDAAHDSECIHFVKVTLPPYSSRGSNNDIQPLKEKTTQLADMYPRQRKQQKTEQTSSTKVDTDDDNNGKEDSAYKSTFEVQLPPFALFSTFRDVERENGAYTKEVFVAIVSTWSYHIYHERIDDDNEVKNIDDSSSGSKYKHQMYNYARFVHFTHNKKTHPESAITAFAIRPNIGSNSGLFLPDVAIGHVDGTIKVMVGLLDHISPFVDTQRINIQNGKEDENDSLEHPEKVVLKQHVHWHAHQVRSLCWMGGGEGNTKLLSGGEESVLLVWQLHRGIREPMSMLPRIGSGSIDSLTPDDYVHDGRIMVYCRDNTIQMFETHNFARKWMVRGLAVMPSGKEITISNDLTTENESSSVVKISNYDNFMMIHDPRTNLPMLTNIAGAPGHIHWFDPVTRRVVGALEVCPYNRISGKDRTVVVPHPRVTHLAISANGMDLVTVDAVLTENLTMGSKRVITNDNEVDVLYYGKKPEQTNVTMGLCNTIRFWSFASKEEGGLSSNNKKMKDDFFMAFELVSAMSSPHGQQGEIVALAMDPKGNKACTLSHEEGAFRVWEKRGNKKKKGPHSTPWKCLYKITTPSGYSNYEDNNTQPTSSVAFSADSSVLAVSYGPFVTLWDHTSASLLTTLTHEEKLSSQISFINVNVMDMMLLHGESSVTVTPPFGENSMHCGKEGWFYGLDGLHCQNESSKPKVTCVTAVPKMGYSNNDNSGVNGVAIAMMQDEDGGGKITTIVVVDEASGDPLWTKDGRHPMSWTVKDRVVSMCCVPGATNKAASRLFILTDRNQMILLESSDLAGDEQEKKGITKYNSSTGAKSVFKTLMNAPRLNVQRGSGQANMTGQKRKRSPHDRKGNIIKKPNRMSGFGAFSARGADAAAQLPTSDLPVLSGVFTTAFVGRNLRKKDAVSEED